MDSILTVVTPADSQDLTTLATVKAELEITDISQDVQLALFIDQASGECATYCKRVFGEETVSEQFRLGQGSRLHRRSRTEELILTRYPIASITSITEEDGTVLVEDVDFEIDPDRGIAWRLSGTERCGWRRGKTVVVYVGGYELLDSLPQTIERACIELVKTYYFASSRDPALRQISLPGVGERQYWVGPKGEPALPSAVTDRLDLYCDMRF
jgi:hypothetical protein